MTISPFFSVIIPTFNRAKNLSSCLIKLKKQSFTNWECIIIDDGSSDNTKEVINQIIEPNDPIFYFYQKNSERSIARNNGASKAKGKYYIFLDSDDEFEVNHLESLFKSIKETNYIKGMYFTNGKIKTKHSIEILETNSIPSSLPIDYFVNHSVIPARVCLHYSIFDRFYFDPRAIIVEDTVLWTEILDQYPVIFIPINSVIYNWHGDNSVNIEKYNAYKQRLVGLKILFYKKVVGKKIDKKTKSKHINRCYIGIFQYYSNKKIKSKKIYWLLLSIFHFPALDLKYKLKLLFNLNY